MSVYTKIDAPVFTYIRNSSGDVTEGQYMSYSMAVYDSKPPRYLSRKAKGWLYPKAYLRDVNVRVNNPSSFFEVRNEKGSYYRLSGSIALSWPGPDLADMSALRIQAETKALSKLKGQKMNISTSLAELKSTASTFSQGCVQIAQMTRSLRNGRAISDVWKRTKSGKLASDVLAYLYGVRPIINDVNGALEELQSRDELVPVVTVKGVVKDPIDQVTRGYFNSAEFDVVHVGWAGAFVRLDYECDNNLLASAGRLGLTNPFATAYELIPFSFALDWAIPIGTWLNNIDAAMGFRFRSGSCSIRRFYTSNTQPLSNWQPNGGWTSFSSNIHNYSSASMLARSPYDASPRPDIYIRNPLNFNSVASGLALLTQAFTSGKK